jgi:hypothetical protein
MSVIGINMPVRVIALADPVDDGREPDRDVGGDWFLVLGHVSP